MKPKRVAPIVALVLIVLLALEGFAQQASNTLVYIRQKRDQSFQLVSLWGTHRQVFQLSTDDCFRVSPLKTFVAISNPKSETIRILQLSDGSPVREVATEEMRSPCAFEWLTESGLGLSSSAGTGQSRFDQILEVLSGNTTDYNDSDVGVTQPAGIPHLLTDDFRLISPDGKLVVYNRCPEGEHTVTPNGDQVCSSQELIVVFDMTTQSTLQVLEGANQYLFAVRGYESLASESTGIGWSPSSRYLSYRTMNDRSRSSLRILDTFTQVTNDLNLPEGKDFARLKGFMWSSNEQSVVFWLNDYSAQGMRLGVFRVPENELVVSRTIFELASTGWTWRQDEQAIVFVDTAKNLIEYNVETESSSVLDTDVWDILTH